MAKGLVNYYTGYRPGDVPGNLPDPYYWWVAGAMFGALVDYWYYTGDAQYNEITTQALLHQVGQNKDYLPKNQSRTAGNDDQGFWGMAVMEAAEVKYPDPPKDQPQWLALAQAVFNTQAYRWDMETCGGGLKWQIFTFNPGFNYKNTISNGCFFNIAARLGRFTGNQTYIDWAEKTWDWMEYIGLITPSYQFYDGSDDLLNCTEWNRIEWTYNAGVFLYGAAIMWNATGADIWRERTEKILEGTQDTFYPEDKPNVMSEVSCEPNNTCDIDQRSFKGFLSRWMAATVKVAPWTRDFVMPKLRGSAQAAAQQCSGGPDGKQCGLKWTQGPEWDGSTGATQQMAALEVIQSNLLDLVPGPVTAATGGTSQGDPAAGSSSSRTPTRNYRQITTADRAGAGILTAITLAGVLGVGVWMSV